MRETAYDQSLQIVEVLRKAAIRAYKYYDQGFFVLYILTSEGLKLSINPIDDVQRQRNFTCIISWSDIINAQASQFEEKLWMIEADAIHSLKKVDADANRQSDQ